MTIRRTLHLTREVAARLVADAVLVAASLLMGLIFGIWWDLDVLDRTVVTRSWFVSTLPRVYAVSLTCLWLIGLGIFVLSGLYTRGRIYRRPYKQLVVGLAVTLSYLGFGALDIVFHSVIAYPRHALIPAWILTLATMTGARIWAGTWAGVVRTEDHIYGRVPPGSKIRNVLVIGGAGYIGSALLPKLLVRGYHVRLLDLLLFGTDPIAHVMNHPHLEIVKADFREVDKVLDAMHDVDAVIHLGGLVGDPACALDEELTLEINLTATHMIAEVARASGIRRFVFASTCSVYGASDGILDEESELNPVSLYAQSKIASERVLRRMASPRFTPVILRFGTVYGLSGRTRFDLVVNLLTAKAMVENQITVFGGDQWRPFVHVDDAALAVFKALEVPERLVSNQVFNVGSDDQNYTIQQVGEIVHRMVPAAQLLSMGSDIDRRNYRVSFAKIRNFLGYAPQWTVEQGVRQVIEAIETGKVKDYRESRYSNVKYLDEARTRRLIRRQNVWVYELLNGTASVADKGDSGTQEPTENKLRGKVEAPIDPSWQARAA